MTPSSDELAGTPGRYRGDAWGDGTPLWTFEGDGWSIDAHGATEDEARAAAAVALEQPAQLAPDDEPVTRRQLAAVLGTDQAAVDAAVDASDMRAAEPPTPPGGTGTPG